LWHKIAQQIITPSLININPFIDKKQTKKKAATLQRVMNPKWDIEGKNHNTIKRRLTREWWTKCGEQNPREYNRAREGEREWATVREKNPPQRERTEWGRTRVTREKGSLERKWGPWKRRNEVNEREESLETWERISNSLYLCVILILTFWSDQNSFPKWREFKFSQNALSKQLNKLHSNLNSLNNWFASLNYCIQMHS